MLALDLKIKADAASGEVIVYRSPTLPESRSLEGDIRTALADVSSIKVIKVEDLIE